MRKAKMSFQSGQVKQVIRTYAVEIQTGDKKDLDADAVTLKLKKAMGANCKFRISTGRGACRSCVGRVLTCLQMTGKDRAIR
jgi:hypothetical protein